METGSVIQEAMSKDRGSGKLFLAFAVLLTALFVFSLGVAEAAEQGRRSPTIMKKVPTGGGTLAPLIIECPQDLHVTNVNIDSTAAAPSGWQPKGYPTGYQSLTLVRHSPHSVLSGKLWCSYAKSSLPTSLTITGISKPVPAGRTCTPITGYKFSCQ